ncbi:MAG: tetratricopeptide repeat protein [Candidatus Campbellbacteria bacterium]|nr:tetratricopeptide repeat protein [Candidatus Campbellbacteria bacterium]
MKEKIRIILVAGTVLVALIAVALLVPENALERRDTGLSSEEIAQQEEVISESREAIRDFDRREEENDKAYYNEYMIIGNASARIGDLRAARSAYENAIEYTEDPQEAIRAIYDMEAEAENYDRARDVLVEATENHPENFAYWNLLIELEKNQFDVGGEELKARIEQAIEATDRATGSLVTYAYYLEDQGEFEEALQYWQEAAALNPQYDAIYAEQIARLEALINEENNQ